MGQECICRSGPHMVPDKVGWAGPRFPDSAATAQGIRADRMPPTVGVGPPEPEIPSAVGQTGQLMC